MANKLELTWYGKDKPIVVEPRILIEDASRSNCAADPDTENMLASMLDRSNAFILILPIIQAVPLSIMMTIWSTAHGST